jgi:lipoate-protein ligase A
MVVAGRSSRVEDEIHLDACRESGVPVFRRVSGGAAVVTGPGCLMYAVVLSYRLRPALRLIDHAHQFVMGTMAAALEPLVPGIEPQGISDLAVDGLKVSGNSVRCKREHLLYHGTLLYDFPLRLMERCLKMPPREPAYRQGRGHGMFLTNMPVEAAAIRQAVARAWQANEPYIDWPRQRTAELVAERYGCSQWNR